MARALARARARALAFEVEGSLVPSVAGSNVHVRVHPPMLVWLLRGLLSVAGALAFAGQIEVEEALPALQLALAVLVASSVVVRVKVGVAMRILEAVLPAA